MGVETEAITSSEHKAAYDATANPRQYEYLIGGGEYDDRIWKPNEQGLGMGHVFDELNKIYGDGFIKYK